MTFALINNAVNFYLPFVHDSIDAGEDELMRWRSYWLGLEVDSLPYNTLGVLLSAKEIHTYPSLEVLLQILTTGPVTTATNKRSCSALRYLETCLRFTTKEDRLNGLVLLFVHRDLNINFKPVIDEFSRKNRRLNFN